MANKKISQLNTLTGVEVTSNDVFCIVDTSAIETKKITAAQLASFLSISGSVWAYHAIVADSASFIYGSNVYGAVGSATLTTTSSFSLKAQTTIAATSASFASNAHTSSYVPVQDQAKTASFLTYNPAESNGTASYAVAAYLSRLATSSSFLVYNVGVNNGTSSNAMMSLNARSSSFSTRAHTASYFSSPPGAVDTASWAGHAATADIATSAISSSFLIYTGGNNGTASYAISAQTYPNLMVSFGVTKTHNQSTSMSMLENVTVIPTSGSAKMMVTAHGTARMLYTASIPTDGDMILCLQDRTTGDITRWDSTPMTIIMGPSVDQWNSYTTGSVRMPFSLVGESSGLKGNYLVYVSASSNIEIDSARSTSFTIDSTSNTIDVYPTESVKFLTVPDCTITFYDTASGGPYYDDLEGFNITQSSIIGKVDVSNQGLTDIRYAWTLPNLTELIISNNAFLTAVSTLSNTCSVLSASGCSLSNAYNCLPRLPLSLSYLDVSNNDYTTLPIATLPISVSYFNCSNNTLEVLPVMSPSLSYFDCHNNNLTSLQQLPTGTLYVNCSYNYLTSVDGVPDTVTIFSFGNNAYVTSIVSLPSQSQYVECAAISVEGLPTMPLSVSYLDSRNNTSFTSSAMEYLSTQLVSNGQVSGTLMLDGCGTPDATTLAQLSILEAGDRFWTITRDS